MRSRSILGMLMSLGLGLTISRSTRRGHKTGPGQRTILNRRITPHRAFPASKVGSTDCTQPYIKAA